MGGTARDWRSFLSKFINMHTDNPTVSQIPQHSGYNGICRNTIKRLLKVHSVFFLIKTFFTQRNQAFKEILINANLLYVPYI